jgi:hypothetical protein
MKIAILSLCLAMLTTPALAADNECGSDSTPLPEALANDVLERAFQATDTDAEAQAPLRKIAASKGAGYFFLCPGHRFDGSWQSGSVDQHV